MNKLLWKSDYNVEPRVYQRPDSGLVFTYRPIWHVAQNCICSYNLFSEVGERYKKYFNGFFESFTLDENPIIIYQYPFVMDQLKQS